MKYWKLELNYKINKSYKSLSGGYVVDFYVSAPDDWTEDIVRLEVYNDDIFNIYSIVEIDPKMNIVMNKKLEVSIEMRNRKINSLL